MSEIQNNQAPQELRGENHQGEARVRNRRGNQQAFNDGQRNGRQNGGNQVPTFQNIARRYYAQFRHPIEDIMSDYQSDVERNPKAPFIVPPEARNFFSKAEIRVLKIKSQRDAAGSAAKIQANLLKALGGMGLKSLRSNNPFAPVNTISRTPFDDMKETSTPFDNMEDKSSLQKSRAYDKKVWTMQKAARQPDFATETRSKYFDAKNYKTAEQVAEAQFITSCILPGSISAPFVLDDTILPQKTLTAHSSFIPTLQTRKYWVYLISPSLAAVGAKSGIFNYVFDNDSLTFSVEDLTSASHIDFTSIYGQPSVNPGFSKSLFTWATTATVHVQMPQATASGVAYMGGAAVTTVFGGNTTIKDLIQMSQKVQNLSEETQMTVSNSVVNRHLVYESALTSSAQSLRAEQIAWIILESPAINLTNGQLSGYTPALHVASNMLVWADGSQPITKQVLQPGDAQKKALLQSQSSKNAVLQTQGAKMHPPMKSGSSGSGGVFSTLIESGKDLFDKTMDFISGENVDWGGAWKSLTNIGEQALSFLPMLLSPGEGAYSYSTADFYCRQARAQLMLVAIDPTYQSKVNKLLSDLSEIEKHCHDPEKEVPLEPVLEKREIMYEDPEIRDEFSDHQSARSRSHPTAEHSHYSNSFLKHK